MESLFSYIYTSQLSPGEPASCVADIVRLSKINNKQRGITGLLVFDGDYFCQYLEGSEIVVRDLIETIKRDSRHINFETRYEGNAEVPRRFENWSIAYATTNQESLDRLFFNLAGLQAVHKLNYLLPSLDLQPM